MKIVLVSCVAPPEPVVAGRVNYDICEYLSSRGFNITLISPFPTRPLGKFKKNQNKKNEISLVNDNFVHVKIKSYQSPEYNFLKRIYESFSFGYHAINYINRYVKNCDFIYATPWPFVGQFIFLKFRNDKNIPVIMNVQDLYPESFFTKYNSLIFKFLFTPFVSVDKYIASNSYHISVVSESLKDVYIKTRGVDSSKISVIENWQNEEEFINANISKEDVLINYNLELHKNKFIFMYLGNIGPVAGLENVIHEYSKIVDSNSILIIAGSGTSRKSCIDLVDNLNINNVLFVEIPAGLKSVVELQSIADVLLLPIQPDASVSSIPSKLIAYMFSSKPILSSAKSDSTTGIAISHNKCGLLVDELNPWTKQMSKFLRMDKHEIHQMGLNSFDFGISRYSKKNGLSKIENLFNEKLKNK